MALEYNATSEYVEVSDDASLTVTTSLSILLWLWRDSTGVRTGIASHTDTASATSGWWLDIRSSGDGNDIQFTLNDTDHFSNNGMASSVDTWYHIAVTYDGTTIRFYENGVAQGTSAETASITDPAASLFVGKDDDFYATVGANGRTQDFRLYNSVLTQNEIITAMHGRPVGTPKLWLAEMGDNATDYSGNGNNGTVTGGPTVVGNPPNGPHFGWAAELPTPTAAAAGGRIMSSLAHYGGLAGHGGLAGKGGGLAG